MLSKMIKGVGHLGLLVQDIEKAEAFYVNKLGFKPFYKKIVIDSDAGALDVDFLQLENLVLEIFRPLGSQKVIPSQTGVLDHFAIKAPELEQCVEKGLADGLQFHESTKDGIVFYENLGEMGVKGANFHGINGEVVEMCKDILHDHGKSGLCGWAHLAIRVSNLQKSMGFYESLGFTRGKEGYLETESGRISIGFMELGEFQLELIENLQAGEKLPDGCLDHVALRVVDIYDAFRLCREKGFQLGSNTVKELSLFPSGIKYFMVQGPDGEKIELYWMMNY